MAQSPLTIVKSEPLTARAADQAPAPPLAIVKSDPVTPATREPFNWADLEKKGGRRRSEFGDMLADAFIGALKGGGQTAVNLGKLVHLIPGVSAAVDTLYGDPGRSSNAFADADLLLTPTNTAQSVGKGIEQVAEAFLPSSLAAKAGVKIGTALASKVPAIVPRMVVEGGAGAATAAAQGASPREIATAGAVSAVVPGGAEALKAGKKAIGAFLSNPNQTLADAVAYVASEGVPIDAATRSGHRFVANAQKRVSESMGGSGVATTFKNQQEDALTDLGERLVKEANPATNASLVSAGDAVTGKLQQVLVDLDDAATKHYDELRAIEARASSTRQVPSITEIDATTTVPTSRTINAPMQAPAFLANAKKKLTPLYAALSKEHKLVPLMGDKGRALVALESIVNGPDIIPLTELDAALGALKAMARGAELPQLRTAGQGAAALAVKELDQAVMKAATDLGPDAVTALKEGRKATVAKYAVQEVRDWLGDLDEPVKVANKLLQSKDAGIRRLEAVAKHAPDQMPEVGQAFLQGLLEKATAEGGFARTDALLADWNRLGSATKAVMFKPDLVKRLNYFFLAAKKIGQNPNPSGTANVMTVFNVGTAPLTYALAKAMYGTQKGIPAMEGLIRTTLTAGLATSRARSER